jgi:hypothetical protein
MSEETQLPEAENGFADSIANFEFESSDGKKIGRWDLLSHCLVS